jgi:hypothetical protein
MPADPHPPWRDGAQIGFGRDTSTEPTDSVQRITTGPLYHDAARDRAHFPISRLSSVEFLAPASAVPLSVTVAIMYMCASEFFCRSFRGPRMQLSDSKTCVHYWARSVSPSASEAAITSFPNRAWLRS